MHVIKLNGYNATTENGEKLELGTFDSYGEEQLQIVEAPDWANLSVIATFNPPNKKPVQVAVDSITGVIKVPKEATADLYGVGTIVFVGIADGVQRISADCEYIVRKHSNASGTEPAEPTPDLLQQVLTLSKDAQTAAKNAEQSAKNAAKDAADTVKPYKEEAVQAATAAALSEKNAAESKATAQEAAERATQAGIAASNAAEEAERSAGIATDAAGGSALNAENARKSALNAQQSANNAAESQSAALAAAASAQRNAEQVAIDAKTAVDAKVAAAGSADAAAGSAIAAGNSASAAARSEQAAGASEVKAAESEKAAKASEQAAAESAQAALESKTAAATSEVNAAASAKKAQDVADSLPEDYTTAVNDIATLKQQVANITPDDSTIGGKPWSSKHIIDMLCPPLEESGNPVVCYPVAGYPLGVKAKWEPVQEGSGTPYPAGGGKNLWGDLIQNTFISQQGVSSGFSGAKTTGKIPCAEGDKYTLSCATTFAAAPGNVGVLAYFDASDAMLTRVANTYQRAFTLEAPANAAYLLASCYKETDADNVQLEKGSVATVYAPYENIRPIKGRDSVRVERCGENLLRINPFNKFTKNGITYEYVPDGGIHISGTALNNVDSPTFPVWHLPPGKYFCLELGSGISASIAVQRNGKNLWLNAKGAFEILAGDVTKYWYAFVSAGATVDKTVYPYIVPGTTAPTTYTPYTGQTATLTLPDTVYGGEVDAVTGEGQETWKSVSLDGTENWRTWGVNKNNTNVTGFFTYDINDYSNDASDINKILCSTMSNEEKYIWGGKNMGVGLASSWSSKYLIYCVTTNTLPDTTDDKKAIASFKTFLANLYAAGTPVQVAYKLATQTPFTATGAQPLPALAGANTVLTDADSATVTGRADPIKRITDLEDAVASQT